MASLECLDRLEVLRLPIKGSDYYQLYFGMIRHVYYIVNDLILVKN